MTKQQSSYTGFVGIIILRKEQFTYYAVCTLLYMYMEYNLHQHEQDQENAAKQRFNAYRGRCRTYNVSTSGVTVIANHHIIS